MLRLDLMPAPPKPKGTRDRSFPHQPRGYVNETNSSLVTHATKVIATCLARFNPVRRIGVVIPIFVAVVGRKYGHALAPVDIHLRANRVAAQLAARKRGSRIAATL